MEFSAPATITSGAGSITANGDLDWLRFTELADADAAELRTPVDNKPQQDGIIDYPILKGAIYPRISGYIKASTVASRNGFEDTLKTILNGMLTAPGTLSITQTGQATRTLAVRYSMPLQLAPEDGIIHKFSFGLRSTEPFWRQGGTPLAF